MGWTKLVIGTSWLALALAGCGGADESAGRGNAAGAATSSGGSNGAATAGRGSGGTATFGGDANTAAGVGAMPSAAGGPSNIVVDELRGREGCLPRSLPIATTVSEGLEAGQVRCAIGFVTFPDQGCECAATQNLKPASVNFARAIANSMSDGGLCGGATSVDCGRMCACALVQCSGVALTQCQTDATPIAQLQPGFCYVDAATVPPLGDPALVATCPTNSRRELRILGPAPDEPAPLTYLGCW